MIGKCFTCLKRMEKSCDSAFLDRDSQKMLRQVEEINYSVSVLVALFLHFSTAEGKTKIHRLVYCCIDDANEVDNIEA